jgi:TonB family protein
MIRSLISLLASLCLLLFMSACIAPVERDYNYGNETLPPGSIIFPETSSDWDVAPKFVKGKAPMTPKAAMRDARFPRRGTAEIAFTVDLRGNVTDINVISATHSQYAAAVIYNLKRWKFTPATKDGVVVEARGTARWTFDLRSWGERNQE